MAAGEIEDVWFGCANQAGEDNRNVARMAALLAGLPDSVAGVTVNRLCASGLSAVVAACHAVIAGDGDLFVAGGVESMSRAPLVMGKPEQAFPRGNRTVWDTTLGWRFPNPRLEEMFALESMGETGENVAERWSVAREEQDAFALESQRRHAEATASGRFRDELVPVGDLEQDEHPRPDTTLEKLASLKPAFRPDGTVTAGNSSGLNDGAAALVIASEEKARELGAEPLGAFVGSAVAGVDPRVMGIGPVPAVRKLLDRLGIDAAEIALVELNEAFASQSLAVIRELGLDPERVNVNGGAIALGHPLGMSGARLVVSLLHELRRRDGRYGVATMCVGVGQGQAALFERWAGTSASVTYVPGYRPGRDRGARPLLAVATRILRRLDELYAIGGGPGANRVSCSREEDEAHELARGWLEEAGLEVEVDEAREPFRPCPGAWHRDMADLDRVASGHRPPGREVRRGARRRRCDRGGRARGVRHRRRLPRGGGRMHRQQGADRARRAVPASLRRGARRAGIAAGRRRRSARGGHRDCRLRPRRGRRRRAAPGMRARRRCTRATTRS